MPVAANLRALLIFQRPAAHVQMCKHAGCPSNCMANDLYKALFAISPLFLLFALRRFAGGQHGGRVQRATARTAPSFSLSRTRSHTNSLGDGNELFSSSDMRKELLSSVRHNLLQWCVHATCTCMFACYSMHVPVDFDQ